MDSDVVSTLTSSGETETRATLEQARTQVPSSPLAIDARGVSKVYQHEGRPFLALHDVTLKAESGDFIALVGPSGCGKSTLLRILAGLTEATSGSVRIDGDAVEGPRRNVGMMLQESTLFPWRTAKDNVLLPVDVVRRRNESDVARANELLETVHLSGFENHYPNELSGGMQQRVALSRVLMTEPTVMLLDEPFGALDEFTREKLNLELASIVGRGRATTVVLVTHNIIEAVFLADRVVAMGIEPGRFLTSVPVPLPRPRQAEQLESDEFHSCVSDVRAALGLGS